MNDLMHEAINKFHTVNIMCGSLALEIEAGTADQACIIDRIKKLPPKIKGEIKRARELLSDIAQWIQKKLNCYDDTEHFFKVIKSSASSLEGRSCELENIINDKNNSLVKKDIVPFLHMIEEKALACAITLKELKDSLVKNGVYTQEK